jgi:hypothetical protein
MDLVGIGVIVVQQDECLEREERDDAEEQRCEDSRPEPRARSGVSR